MREIRLILTWLAISATIATTVFLGTLLVARCDAEPKRHASPYLYNNERPWSLDRSQSFAREHIVPPLGGQAGYLQAIIFVELLESDPLPERMLWPHAAGVDSVWFRELPDPEEGERSFVLVGREGRGIPDSVRVEHDGAEPITLEVRRKQ